MAKNKNNNNRSSINLLPAFFRTSKNNKFLSSTLDQLIKVPSLERIDGYVGSKLSKNYNPRADVYISESLPEREKYQFEPALVLKKLDQSIKEIYTYDDLINQVKLYGGDTTNLDRLFRPKFNVYDPHIDWDKLINFREYYWMPMGPDAVIVTGLQKNAVSTYTVTDSADKNFLIFTPDGLTPDPLLTLYRGLTYVFNIDSVHTVYLKTDSVDGTGSQYNNNVIGNGTKKGQIVITVDNQTPSVLFYASAENQLASGRILVKSIAENSKLDVEKEIVGKSQYRSSNGIEFINGLKVRFVGDVTPVSYKDKDFIIEGVGNQIKLVDFSTLATPLNVNTTLDPDFDQTPFDEFPFDDFSRIPETPEYITINRASKDLNPWSRYNRWVHKDVLTASANANGILPTYPYDQQAKRPIIEFNANIQLWNFGTDSVGVIDYIDDITTDAFSEVEGAYGYYVDGVKIEDGNLVIFNADKDPLVNGKVYRVNLSIYQGKQKIRLTEIITPTIGNTVVVRAGNNYAGTSWHWNGTDWIYSQQHTTLNETPLFDLFDRNGHSYSDKNYFDAEFYGNRIFGYTVGTGVNDSVLGFPLQYTTQGITSVGSYLFTDYLNTEQILLNGLTDPVPTYETYLKFNKGNGSYDLINAWTEGAEYLIPVQQFQVITNVTSNVEVTVFDNPTTITDLVTEVYINDAKQLLDVDYVLTSSNKKLYITFHNEINGTGDSKRVLFKFYTKTAPNSSGTYEVPLNLVNNPTNGFISNFTLSELSDHVKSMADRCPDFIGEFPGVGNLKSLPNITKYGTRLIVNHNPLSFAQCFISNPAHNLISATRQAASDFYQYKLNLIKFASKVGGTHSISEILDLALQEMNKNKNSSFPYAKSDMLGQGDNNITGVYTVTDERNVEYSLPSIFSMDTLSNRSVLVYLTSNNVTELLLYGKDYSFLPFDSSVSITRKLTKGDVITIKDYVSTIGSYIPPTPTKLGLYPKYEPMIYVDTTYANEPQKVIQGHDGSITVAYSRPGEADDYRDLLLLEFEKRIFNNIKVNYNPELINIHDILPGVFRDSEFSYKEVYGLVNSDFMKWTSVYGLNFIDNTTYDIGNHKTYNFKSAIDNNLKVGLPGNWRAIYKLYFDTDRPNTHPWEMLGFTIKPTWWDDEYGEAPYTSGNWNMWQDIEAGIIRQGERAGVNPTYVRPGLSNYIPVDDSGNIVDVREWAAIGQNDAIPNTDQNWAFGDHGPVETTWRRSSLWPFAVQIILALTKPADYAAMMFDTSRLKKDVTGQYNYGPDEVFLNPSTAFLFTDTDSEGNTILSSGYSVWVIENGLRRSANYLSELKEDLSSLDFNLSYKAGGFLSKDKLDIVIDSISPTTVNPGVLLPNEDYTLFFNTSPPVRSVSASGIIVEKKNGKFVVKGYDKQRSYFTINRPLHQATGSAITVGGKSEPYLNWRENTFYKENQVVYHLGYFYRVRVSHTSGTAFVNSFVSPLDSLATVGGATVLTTNQYEEAETQIPYGTQYDNVQDVYDLIVGYGQWLTSQGFIFNTFNKDLNQVIDWKFTGKEFLYWTTQNWADTAVITLSPFADTLQYRFNAATVDNVLNSFYEYSLQTASGQPMPTTSFNVSREDGICTIQINNPNDGLFFARLNLVQKEHVLVLNNISLFNDVIYDTETGYRQTRIKLTGFRTAEWNGEFLSPGFIYDESYISEWKPYTDYQIAEIVKYAGKYYSANTNTAGTEKFDFNSWTVLGEKPVAELLPNFDYKINQFEDFYSLDIDNFDAAQQKMAQHLIGYTPRVYLDNIFSNPIAQYKFYQGFIREKGTQNAIDKMIRASIHNLQGHIDYKEEWAFRVGSYGNFTSYKEIELPLREADFRENSQIVKFVDTPPVLSNDILSYVTPDDLTIKSDDYSSDAVFSLTTATYADNNLLLPTAGYVRLDDVIATAYNKTSLLDIANTGEIKDGDTIWLGFRDDGQWDVYRYTIQDAKIVDSAVTIEASELTFTTDRFHNFSVGETVAIYGLTNNTDGVYIVKSTPTLTTFTVDTPLTTVEPSTSPALTFKFVSVRVSEFDDIAKLQNLIRFNDGNLVWADSNATGKWTVYQKTDNYSTSTELPIILTGQVNPLAGSAIYTSDDSNILVLSAPSYLSQDDGIGRVFVYSISGDTVVSELNYGLNSIANEIVPNSAITNFGQSLVYDPVSNFVFAGAPLVDLVKLSGINLEGKSETQLAGKILYNPTLASEKFGSSLFVNDTTSTNKFLLVGAPAAVSNTGKVYAFTVNISTSTITYSNTSTVINSASAGSLFGSVISGTSDGTRFAISAPNDDGVRGKVYVYYSDNSSPLTINLLTEIVAPPICKFGDKFGQSVAMSADGTYLVISSPTSTDATSKLGKVFVYQWNEVTYELIQTIDNPSADINLTFGYRVTIDKTNTMLVVTGKGDNSFSNLTFDNGNTTFDNTACVFGELVVGSGSAYVFERVNEKFIYAEELFDNTVVRTGQQSSFGESVSARNGTIFIGAPTKIISNVTKGGVYRFDKRNLTQGSWTPYRVQNDLVDLSKVKRARIIDTKDQKIVNYLDIIDPLKGKISGIADQELRYKTAFDPAVYSIGTQGVVVDTDASWIEEHVGELWWDLSTAKYIWYEQGDLEYRKNTWGNLFPGASIDVYEWVRSEYLPSQWSALADTVEGLTKGISGQPKYPDNSVVSVKQYYNSLTGGMTNIYFYWVKNKVTLPDVDSRKVSANDVARLIFNPAAYGTEFISILSNDAISVTNVTNSLSQNNIYLNIAMDDINNDVNQHTEWALLADGDANRMPPALLDKKLIDSLLGRDSLGNLVPDPTLPERIRYGIEIRPRQGLFKDRKAALRNMIDYTNSVLEQNIVNGVINFSTLNSKDPIPDIETGLYDRLVENEEELATVITVYLQQASMTCEITNGRITGVSITNPGYGYLVAPTVEIVDDQSGAIITTEIDENGSVISATIKNQGKGFIATPNLVIRPFTVIVSIDPASGNRWSAYQWTNNQWNRTRTQNFDTTLYWDYIDWKSTGYDPVKPLIATIDQPYQLETLDLLVGDYVKVKNQGNGLYVVLEKVNGIGTFGNGFDLIYSEKGTIKIKEELWNTANSPYNFDYLYTFDQTLYDQSSDIELEKIIFAIKNDIFVGPLKVYWNKFFFKAVRYAMSEQIFLDWAFKTSFLDVANIAGTLDQRPVYKFQNSQYYEDYLNEVKPYHSKIRNFRVEYSVVEPTQSYTTDFDLPPIYDKSTDTFIPTELGDEVLTSYPYKGWADNYKYNIGSIVISDGGNGYTSTPEVRIIPAPGDVVTTATAVAYISLGKVIEIEITNPGEGYTQSPTVLIVGGGSTTLTPARAYARLSNGKVRANTIGIKLDRVSGLAEIGSKTVSDKFVANGSTNRFRLSWAAENLKSNITVTENGIKVFEVQYDIDTYTQVSNDYHKLFSDLVMSYIPENGSLIEISYNKNINLYHAAERIVDYYNSVDGMPGDEIGQLIKGVDYPGTQIQTLPYSYNSNWDMLPFTEAAWADDNAESILDTVIDGGNLAYTVASGLNPEDIILDGDAFLSPNVSHAPDELVPGEVLESVGITVFTREPFGSPIISQSVLPIASTSSVTTATLAMMPSNTSSVIVSFNNRILNYGVDYTTDYVNKTITVNTQTATGLAAITIVGVGGTEYNAYEYVTTSNTTTVTIVAGVQMSTIGSVYVTVNGNATANYTTNKNGITVNGLSTGTNIVQSWYFRSPYKGYSEIREEFFNVTPSTTQFVLSQYPATLEPINAQAIVELDKVRLTPPNTVYYSATVNQTTFDIDPNQTYPQGIYDLSTIQVFVNGIRMRNAIDFILDQPNSQVIFPLGVIKEGDAVAITETLHSQYYFDNGNVYLKNITLPQAGILKVITFTTHDGDQIRTEVFSAGSVRQYTMSRTVINDDYVWVTIGGNPLINGYDYRIGNDHKTVIIDPQYPMNPADNVVIMSMTDRNANYAIAYRMFKDILNRVTYKRISSVNTTRLVEPLYTTSTTIVVENGSVLSKPNPAKNAPGVILIAAERIEYMELNGNVLSRLKRATLGTGPKDVYTVGTAVIDQSIRQNLPYREVMNVNTATMINTGITSYVIEEMGVKYGSKITTNMLVSGLDNTSTSTNYDNQLKVFYGGIPLRKDGMYIHDQTFMYDAVSPLAILGTVNDPLLLPETTVIGNSYIVTSDSVYTGTNHVWVYTNSLSASSINGYDYYGLTYLPPQYEINTLTNTQTVLTLLLPHDNLYTGTIITVVHHQIAKDWYENTTTSLLYDLGEVATFMRDRPAALPDKYYYGKG